MAAADQTAIRKTEKYSRLTFAHLFIPFKTLGPINTAGVDFILLLTISGKSLEVNFLF